MIPWLIVNSEAVDLFATTVAAEGDTGDKEKHASTQFEQVLRAISQIESGYVSLYRRYRPRQRPWLERGLRPRYRLKAPLGERASALYDSMWTRPPGRRAAVRAPICSPVSVLGRGPWWGSVIWGGGRAGAGARSVPVCGWGLAAVGDEAVWRGGRRGKICAGRRGRLMTTLRWTYLFG